jgi:phytoene synthase
MSGADDMRAMELRPEVAAGLHRDHRKASHQDFDSVDNGFANARGILAKGSKSFALAGKLLPAQVRDDAAVVYAFCRRADDLVDEPTPGTSVADVVARLGRETTRIYEGAPQTDPVLRAFQEVVFRRTLPRGAVDDLIAGFEMDARVQPQVYETWDELLLYCYRVAGTVGLLMCQVMGARDPKALRYAAALGMGMQLTNIARDVAEDWERGRLYLPRQALLDARFNKRQPTRPQALTPRGPLTPAIAADLAPAVTALLDAAEPFYRWGDAGLAYLEGTCAVGVRAARLIYSDIGRVIRARGCDVRSGRAVLSRGRKLWMATRAVGDVVISRWFRRSRRDDDLPVLPGPLPAPFVQLLQGDS